MNPSIDDRLGSVVRAMTDIILPALPDDASLAKEQLQLAIGHIQILRGQIGKAAAFEAEELADAQRLAGLLLQTGEGGPAVTQTLGDLRGVMAESGETPSVQRERINRAIHDVIRSAAIDGSTQFRARLAADVIAQEEARAAKDRRWFAPMGFDQDFAG